MIERTPPIVSVVIPTHNRFRMLRRAVASVLAQTYEPFELIVVDDASTDETPRVSETFGDPRLRYLRREASGSAAGARNTGIEAARGELIVFLDDDDEYLPGFITAMATAFATAGPEVGFGWCGTRTIRRTAAGEEAVAEHVWNPSYATREIAARSIMLARRIGTNAGFAIRRGVVERVGGFDESLSKAEDTEFLIRVSRVYDFLVVPEVLVAVHLHEGPRLTSYDDRMAAAYASIVRKNMDVLEGDPELWTAFHHKTAWLHYHAGDRKSARRYGLRVLRRDPFHLRTWAVMGLFELTGGWGPSLHRRLAAAMKSRIGAE